MTGATSAHAPILQVVGLTKRFGATAVLKNINLDILPSQVVGIIGPSGSGKSTLLRCINFLEEPTDGAVYLKGERVGIRTNSDGSTARAKDHELAAQRRRMSMVFQAFNLFPHMTVMANLMIGPVKVAGRDPDTVRSECLQILTKVRLLEKADEYPARLSGGQQQRVGIARALAMRPEVMLFDEPTSALDPETVDEVLTVMRELAAEGQTMIVVTHEMDFARDACDLIYLLANGEIADNGTPEHIFSTSTAPRTRDFVRRYVRRQ